MKGAASERIGLNVSRETRERLQVYAALLEKWNTHINLVAKSTIADLWVRHFLDSAQLLDLADPEALSWVDLGSGGGFPGLVVAIMAKEMRPELRVTCVESDHRKAAFLRTVLANTGVDAVILTARIENIAPLEADVLSARALAPLPRLLSYAERHLKPDGTALFPKGVNHAEEVREALESWAFGLDTYPSNTDSDAVILKIGEIRRV